MITILVIIGVVWGCVQNSNFRKSVAIVAGIAWVLAWIATGEFTAFPLIFGAWLLPV